MEGRGKGVHCGKKPARLRRCNAAVRPHIPASSGGKDIPPAKTLKTQWDRTASTQKNVVWKKMQ